MKTITSLHVKIRENQHQKFGFWLKNPSKLYPFSKLRTKGAISLSRFQNLRAKKNPKLRWIRIDSTKWGLKFSYKYPKGFEILRWFEIYRTMTYIRWRERAKIAAKMLSKSRGFNACHRSSAFYFQSFLYRCYNSKSNNRFSMYRKNVQKFVTALNFK